MKDALSFLFLTPCTDFSLVEIFTISERAEVLLTAEEGLLFFFDFSPEIILFVDSQLWKNTFVIRKFDDEHFKEAYCHQLYIQHLVIEIVFRRESCLLT